MNLQHLRRFAKPEHLPPQFKNASLCDNIESRSQSSSTQPQEEGNVPNGDLQGDRNAAKDDSPSTLHLLICAASILPYEHALKIILSTSPFNCNSHTPHLRTIPIPLFPPTSEAQAKQWSETYWPTVYKKNNPFGPHPSLVSRAEDEIRPLAGEWMALARRAGIDTWTSSIGEPIGAVIVDPHATGGPSAIVIAGDARWKGSTSPQRSGGGNIMAHATMRAISQVAKKRLAMLRDPPAPDNTSLFADYPLTPIETAMYSQNNLAAGGYLCLDLEIYTTHEPCIMCSMALLHSRFSKVVFQTRMPHTGGLASEVVPAATSSGSANIPTGGLGYGLFWRPELNWKLLAWQWVDEEPLEMDLDCANVHA